MRIGFRAEDYERWKEGYGASVECRRPAGEVSRNVSGDTTDPDVVSLASERDNTERVHAFHDSHEFKAGMKAAGILEMERMVSA